MNQPHHTAYLLCWLRCLFYTIFLHFQSLFDRPRVRRISAPEYAKSWWRLPSLPFLATHEYLLRTTSLPALDDARTPSSTVFRQIRVRSLYPIDNAEGTIEVTSTSTAALDGSTLSSTILRTPPLWPSSCPVALPHLVFSLCGLPLATRLMIQLT